MEIEQMDRHLKLQGNCMSGYNIYYRVTGRDHTEAFFKQSWSLDIDLNLPSLRERFEHFELHLLLEEFADSVKNTEFIFENN